MNSSVRWLKPLAWLVGILAVLFGLMQLVPYGRAHANPPTVQEPLWDSPRTRELAKRACFDCHSNETRWPRYASFAPLSWVVQRDVDSGREVMNFSEWNLVYEHAEYSGSSVQTGNMPPLWYKWKHGEADLTDAETAELARGLNATLKPPR